MKSKIMINVIIIYYLFLLFPFFVYAANVSLPYHRDFESDTVDTPMDDGNCNGLDESDSSYGCNATIRDDYPARHGSNYLELKCDYVDCDGVQFPGRRPARLAGSPPEERVNVRLGSFFQ